MITEILTAILLISILALVVNRHLKCKEDEPIIKKYKTYVEEDQLN